MLISVTIIFLFCFLFCKNETGWESEVMKTKQTETGSWRNLFLRSCPRKPVYETATDWFQGISLLCLYIPNLKLFTQFIAWAILQAIQFTAKKASVTVNTLLLRDGHVLKFRRKRHNYMLYPILLFLSPGFVFFFPLFLTCILLNGLLEEKQTERQRFRECLRSS